VEDIEPLKKVVKESRGYAAAALSYNPILIRVEENVK